MKLTDLAEQGGIYDELGRPVRADNLLQLGLPDSIDAVAPLHLGRNAVVGANCKFGRNCRIGNDVIVGDGVVLEEDVVLFSRVYIFPGAYLERGTELNSDVVIGPNVFLSQGTQIGDSGTVADRKSVVTLARFGNFKPSTFETSNEDIAEKETGRFVTIYAAGKTALISIGCQDGLTFAQMRERIAAGSTYAVNQSSADHYAEAFRLGLFDAARRIVVAHYDARAAEALRAEANADREERQLAR